MNHPDRAAARRATADDILRAREKYWPEAATPITRLMVRIFRFAGLIFENARREVATLALSFTEFEVLVTLRGVAPPHALTPTELSGAVLISSGGLTKVLGALERRHLIRRERGADRRVKPVRLTAKGRALAERVMAKVVRSDGALIARGLSRRELATMTRLAAKLLVTLEPGDGPRPEAARRRSLLTRGEDERRRRALNSVHVTTSPNRPKETDK